MDGWRRPKPEHWLARQIFSPVWFPVRRLPFRPGQRFLDIPVENRFAFTDLGSLTFEVRCRGRRKTLRLQGPPGSTAMLRYEPPADARPGDTVVIEPKRPDGESIVTATLWLGEPATNGLSAQCVARPRSLVSADTGFQGLSAAGALGWPKLHLTRFDFGDLWLGQPPFAVLPEGEPEIEVSSHGTALAVRQSWPSVRGTVTMEPVGGSLVRVAYDFVYDGPGSYAREIGLRIPLRGQQWMLSWNRWCEWGDAPAGSCLRSRGSARPWRGSRRSSVPESVPPRWPWALDETEEGTADFRSAKFHVIHAVLSGRLGGIEVHGNAHVHVRAAIEGRDTAFYLLTRCGLGPTPIRPGTRLQGAFTICFLRRTR